MRGRTKISVFWWVELAALCETAIYDSGIKSIGDYTLLYSGLPSVNKTRSAHGVAVVLDKRATNNWKQAGSEWQAITERIVKVRLKCTLVNITFVAVYAPVNPCNKTMVDNSEKFYMDLQEAIDGVPKEDMIVLMGDFNARISQPQHSTTSRIMGPFTVDVQNENGERLIDFCTTNNLVVSNSFFQHKSVHQTSWMHPGTMKWHLLDYTLIIEPTLLDQIKPASLSTMEQHRQDKEPTLDEVQQALQQMKNRKAPGKDNVTAELLKAGGIPVIKWLHEIFVDIWKNEQMVADWTLAIIIRLYKNKGDKKICDNYRGISLLVVASKIFTRVILNRIQLLIDKQLLEEQAGFRTNRSKIDQVFILKMVMEKTRELNKPLHMCFIDIQKCYDLCMYTQIISIIYLSFSYCPLHIIMYSLSHWR
ncbi:unnamed protein product [Rotaria socialis]|uniref:Reverse transcriptase domain-containing protein n=1 Tax=Rotaria socialis TaxID=392032 RepID=A0A821V3T4_9BILA|nr:unnamed protein product [Rotaria socialis]